MLKTNKATLVVIVIVLVVMLVGIITADTEDVSLRDWAFARRSSPAVSLNRNMGIAPASVANGFGRPSPSYRPSGGLAPQPKFTGRAWRLPPLDSYRLAGGVTPPQYANIQGGGAVAPPYSAPQGRVPGEGSWLGMEIEGLSPGTIRELGLPQNSTGVIVDDVPPGSIAEKAGLQNGDIIKAINGQAVINMADYIKASNNQKLQSATLRIERNGRVLDIPVIRRNTTVGAALAGQQSWVVTPSPGTGVDTYTSASPKLSRVYNNSSIPPITVNSPMHHVFRGVCEKCHFIGPAGGNPLYPPTYSRVGGMNPGNYSLPTPIQQQASRKVRAEGHWLGMELIPITSELAREYNLSPGATGLLVDEVTLESAESGLLAGDILRSINNMPFTTLRDFELVTRRVESLPAVELGVLRNGRPAAFTLRSSWGKLGVAQNEAAQPIQPGALSPHKDMGRPCTDCHIIMKSGGQLANDAGDILPAPRPITLNSKAPHSYKGLCNNCHPIVR